MNRDSFWMLFGSIWLAVGLSFLLVAGSLMIVATSDRTLLLGLSFFGSFLSIAGGTIVTVALRTARMRRRLLTAGVRAPATVVDVRAMDLRVNGRPQWRLKYEYRDHQSRAHQRSMYLDADEAGRWKRGDRGDVLFDPDRSARAMWLGKSR